jgi:hypothetical protein
MKEERVIRVKQLHDEEVEQWGFHARDRRWVWVHKVEHPVTYQSHVQGHEFDSQWVSLDKEGLVTVHAGKDKAYAWDGCSPKIALGKQFIIGTPDGYKDIYMEMPITGKASLIHDALYQYLHIIPIPKVEVDKMFRDILKDEGFVLWPLYYLAVRLFGGWFVNQEGLNGVYYEKYRPIYLENKF